MAVEIPASVRRLLHDCAAADVSWERQGAFLCDRILADGPWSAILWLRRTAGDDALREHILATQGRRLSPRQLRFWQLILDLPDDAVTAWLAAPGRQVWDRRSA